MTRLSNLKRAGNGYKVPVVIERIIEKEKTNIHRWEEVYITLEQAKERGLLFTYVFNNKTYTKAIILLMLGYDNNSKIINQVNPSTWANTIKPNLIETKLIKAKESSKKKNNKDTYLVDWDFDWNMLYDCIRSLIKNDVMLVKQRLSDTKTYIENTLTVEDKKLSKLYNKLRKEFKPIKKGNLDIMKYKDTIYNPEGKEEEIEVDFGEFIAGFVDWETPHDRYLLYKDIDKEIDNQLKKIDQFLKEVNDYFSELINREALKSALIRYFKELILFKEKYDSLNQELRKWFFAQSFISPDHIVSIYKKYNYFYNMDIEWLIELKPTDADRSYPFEFKDMIRRKMLEPTILEVMSQQQQAQQG